MNIDKKIKSEEWGAWKFVSDMLDNPDENGIYPTGKCYEQIYDFVVAQKRKAFEQQRINFIEKLQKAYGVDGQPALVIIEDNECGGTTQRHGLDDVINLIKSIK